MTVASYSRESSVKIPSSNFTLYWISRYTSCSGNTKKCSCHCLKYLAFSPSFLFPPTFQAEHKSLFQLTAQLNLLSLFVETIQMKSNKVWTDNNTITHALVLLGNINIFHPSHAYYYSPSLHQNTGPKRLTSLFSNCIRNVIQVKQKYCACSFFLIHKYTTNDCYFFK